KMRERDDKLLGGICVGAALLFTFIVLDSLGIHPYFVLLIGGGIALWIIYKTFRLNVAFVVGIVLGILVLRFLIMQPVYIIADMLRLD
ncbi:MAG: hypothetical protein Q8P35_00065, partial [Candidatus Yanofskybacteria bacterium]|nr:hypothetical protein [Candidatus Yanofskybacteria bacterium]